MSRLAILGATSQIARDLIVSFASNLSIEAVLFSRDPARIEHWATAAGIAGRFPARPYADFIRGRYNAVINFVGVGDPARAAQMGPRILEVTWEYDTLALNYLLTNPGCRYVFLSSGAVYGGEFRCPATSETLSRLAINALQPQDYYAVAKLYAECRHRAMSDHAIIDLRVFNYFSRTQSLQARFLISDILRAIRNGEVLKTTSQPMKRDFIHPRDFATLIACALGAREINVPLDCYSRAPVDKQTLLQTMAMEFGLTYVIDQEFQTINATGIKENYYSINYRAAEFGYTPELTSIEGIVEESRSLLSPV